MTDSPESESSESSDDDVLDAMLEQWARDLEREQGVPAPPAEPDAVTHDEIVDELLSEWVREYEGGRDIPAEELARGFPELANELASCIEHLRSGMSAPLQTLKRGDEPLPGFVLIEQLGRGSFGEVWSAGTRENRGLAKFAVKVVRSKGAKLKLEQEGLDRMKWAAHPGVLRILHQVRRGDALYLVTELADDSLDRHFNKLRGTESLPAICARSVHSLTEIAKALDFLEAELHLAHQDIKPANLLLVGGVCKLGDFGTVRRLGGKEGDRVMLVVAEGVRSSTTIFPSLKEVRWEEAFRSGATLYTVGGSFTTRYASPERLGGKASSSSDQYSLAITFCELVANVTPFQSEGDANFIDRLEGRMKLDFLPEPLHPVIRKALAPRPVDRFGSCVEFITALRNALIPLVPQRDHLFLQESQEFEQSKGPRSGRIIREIPLDQVLDALNAATKPTEGPKSRVLGMPFDPILEALNSAAVPSGAPRSHVTRSGPEEMWPEPPRVSLIHRFERFGTGVAGLARDAFASSTAFHVAAMMLVLAILGALIPATVHTVWLNRISEILAR